MTPAPEHAVTAPTLGPPPSTGGSDPCCRDHDVDHCHGTYVRHLDAGECTDPDCHRPAEAHDHTVPCADGPPGCGCR